MSRLVFNITANTITGGDGNKYVDAGNSSTLQVKLSSDVGSITIDVVCNDQRLTLDTTQLSFTSGNYDIYQNIGIITNVFSTEGESLRTIPIIFQVHDDNYDVFVFRLFNSTESRLGSALIGVNVDNLFHFSNQSELVTLQNNLISNIYNGGGLPTAAPNESLSNVGYDTTYMNPTDVTNLLQIDRYRFDNPTQTIYQNYVYHLIPQTTGRKGKAVWVCYGHGSAYNETSVPIGLKHFVNQGYDVFCSYSVNQGPNAPQGTTHNFESLATGGFNPLSMFIFHFHRMNFYIQNTIGFNDIYFVGISLGSFLATLLSATDNRVLKSFGVDMGSSFLIPQSTEWEQASQGTFAFIDSFYTSFSMMDLYCMAAYLKEHYQIYNRYNSETGEFYGKYYDDWKLYVYKVKEKLKNISGTFNLELWTNYKKHAFDESVCRTIQNIIEA